MAAEHAGHSEFTEKIMAPWATTRTNELGEPLPDTMLAAMPDMPTPGQQQITNDQNQLQHVRWEQANPWGTAENHPGKLGKLAHTFSSIGNIAGNVVAPDVMARIPGTQLNLQEKEGDLAKRLNTEITNEGENQQREASTKKTAEETEEMPGKTRTEEELQRAQTENITNPHEDWKAIPSLVGPNGEPVEIESRSGNVRFGGVKGTGPQKQPKPDTPEQQYIDEYAKLHPGSTVAEAERQYSLDTQRPPQISPVLMVGPGGKLAAYGPGSTIPEGAATPTQIGSANAAEGKSNLSAGKALNYANSYLNSGQFTGPGDEALQDQFFEMAKPSSGFRMNQAQIDQLHRMQSWLGSAQAAALHAQTGTWFSPQQRKEIVQTMNSLGTAKGIKTPEGSPTRPANVPEGYIFKDGPKGKGWYKP
jgi:hypothetical protein